MRSSLVGTALIRVYRWIPLRSKLLRLVTHTEGGEMFSRTLRAILARHHGVIVGDYSYGSLLTPGAADPGTEIERYVSIGPNVRRVGAAHPKSSISMHPFWYNPRLGLVDASHDVERTSCSIGSDAWIGTNVVILPGCRSIGIGAVVGACAVVSHDVDDFEIVAGVPAVSLGYRFPAEERARILGTHYWEGDVGAVGRFLETDRRPPPAETAGDA